LLGFLTMLPAGAPTLVYGAVLLLVAALSFTWHIGVALVFSTDAVQRA